MITTSAPRLSLPLPVIVYISRPSPCVIMAIIAHAGQRPQRPVVTPDGRTSDTSPTGERVQNRLSGDPMFRRRLDLAGFQDLASVSASMPSSVS